MPIKEILKETEDKMIKSVEATKREFSEVRTGRASTSLVEGIKVDYYGTPTSLKQLATISTPDPRLIVIHPWDPSTLNEIEKAIFKANIGLTPTNDGKVIRLSVPELTKERREELIKLVKDMAEDGRVSVRTVRRDANEKIKKIEKEEKISEDERYKTQEKIQELTDKYIGEIDKFLEEKVKELSEF